MCFARCGTHVSRFALNLNHSLQQKVVVVDCSSYIFEALFGGNMAGEVPRSVLRSDVKCFWGLSWEGRLFWVLYILGNGVWEPLEDVYTIERVVV